MKRSTRNSMIAGVCAGVAQALGWPVGRTRIAYVVLSFASAGFPGILVYLLLWFVMPKSAEW
jgi:phage shock protein C